MKSLPRYSILLTSASLLFGSVAFGQPSAAKAPTAQPKSSAPAPAASAPAAADSSASAASAKTSPAPGMVLPTPPKDSPVAASATGALDVGQAVDAIQMQTFENRDKVTAEVEQRLTSSSTRMDGFKAQLSGLTDEGKMQFDTASKDAEKRRTDLQASLAAAHRADQNSWEGTRAQLAADYARYAEAVARAEIGLTKTVPPAKEASK